MTTTTAELLEMRYVPRYADECRAALPVTVWIYDDGRVECRYSDDRRAVLASLNALGDVHPYTDARRTGEWRLTEADPLPVTYAAGVDWAEIHHAAAEVDRARSGSRIGFDGIVDAYGGSYSYVSYRTLTDLVCLAAGTSQIAEDAWTIVHGASQARKQGDEGAVERARQACRVAIACSHLFALLHRAGLISDPRSRICGTGEGYGLTGLRWLAGEERETEPLPSERVRWFAAGGALLTEAQS